MMRLWLQVLWVLVLASNSALGQEDKKTDESSDHQCAARRFAGTSMMHVTNEPSQPGRNGSIESICSRKVGCLLAQQGRRTVHGRQKEREEIQGRPKPARYGSRVLYEVPTGRPQTTFT